MKMQMEKSVGARSQFGKVRGSMCEYMGIPGRARAFQT